VCECVFVVCVRGSVCVWVCVWGVSVWGVCGCVRVCAFVGVCVSVCMWECVCGYE
jgi:hypothetical protein